MVRVRMAAYDQRLMTKEAISPCDNQLRLLRESEHLNFNFSTQKTLVYGDHGDGLSLSRSLDYPDYM